MKTLVKCVILLFLSSLTVACTQRKPIKIGVSQCSEDDWRRKMNQELEREALFHDGVKLEIRSANDSSQKQIADLHYFADNGFDAIIVAPNEADALTPAIEEIYSRGIPVVVFDRKVNGDSFTAFQGADNAELGRSAARMAASLVHGDIYAIEIQGLPTSTPAAERRRGFAQVVADNPSMTIVASAPGDWNDVDATRVADSMLRAYPQANLIYAHNDRMAIAASQVARRLGRDDIKIVGIDGAPQIGVKAVADSVINATFIYPTEGYQLLRTALAIVNHEPYKRIVELPATSAVDSSNADILLLQDQEMQQETDKVEVLKGKVNDFIIKEENQRVLFIAIGAIAILLAGVVFLLLRTYWSNRRHHAELQHRNAELARQRDELDSLLKQLQEATNAKLVFYSNVSHDLRTPLTLVADPVEQLLEADNLTPTQQRMVALADKNVKVLTRLINQILDFRKYENGALQLNLCEMDLAQALTLWVDQFRVAAGKRHLRLSLDVAANADYHMAVDAEKMERVLFNLISNAFKFTPANGSVNVRLAADGERLTISVADTGVGMSADQLSHIFERFYRAESIHAEGSGIGLTVAKSFVELHGGTIEFASEPSVGTTFTVTLPIRHVDNAAPAPAVTQQTAVEELTEVELPDDNADAQASDAPTILVIDDNADIRALLHDILSDNYRVLAAADGGSGIRLASRHIPDLIICDVMMPGIDGMEVCRHLKGEVTTCHIPILMLTACALDEQRAQGYECGADAYLEKPFNSKVLRARCDSLIANRRLISEARRDATFRPEQAKEGSATLVSDPTRPASDIDDEFYARFLRLLEENYANSELSVELLAQQIGLSRVQFYRKIKAISNYSPVELLRNYRLRKAQAMLKSSTRTVSEIAYAVGFSNPGYFTRCYRDYFNEAPTDTQQRTSKFH